MRRDPRAEAVTIVERAAERGISVRIAGSVGVVIVAGVDPGERPAPIKDIDLVTERGFRGDLQELLHSMDWELVEEFLQYSDVREIFMAPTKSYTLDLYYNEIDGSHPLYFAHRLDRYYPTLSTIDLLLSKLQRQYLRPQDEWDCCRLFRSNVADDDVEYFARTLAVRWGLYTTVIDNLTALYSVCEASDSIKELAVAAARQRKTLRWILRSWVGRRRRWWREIYPARVFGPGEAG